MITKSQIQQLALKVAHLESIKDVDLMIEAIYEIVGIPKICNLEQLKSVVYSLRDRILRGEIIQV